MIHDRISNETSAAVQRHHLGSLRSSDFENAKYYLIFIFCFTTDIYFQYRGLEQIPDWN